MGFRARRAARKAAEAAQLAAMPIQADFSSGTIISARQRREAFMIALPNGPPARRKSGAGADDRS